MPPILELENVRKTFAGPDGSVTALRDFSLAVQPGEFVTVRGPSGSGKTTMLFIGGGLLHPDCGTVRMVGVEIYAMNTRARADFRARHIGFVFQEFYLLPYLTVLDNVLTPCLALHMADAQERAREILKQLGLDGRSRHRPDALSTGERQRVALARALIARPKLLLADEPTGNLDADSAHAVDEVFTNFAKEGGAVVLVTHDDRVAAAAARTVQLAG